MDDGLDAAPSPVRILVVDDDPRNLAAFDAALVRLGYTIVEAHSGTQALRALLADDFAVVVLDVQLPGLDGFEVARMIRSRPRSERTPIIFLTAYDKQKSHVRRAYELGAVDYMFKPVDADILRAKVQVLVDLRRQIERIHVLERVRVLADQRAAHERALLEMERAANAALQKKALELERSNEELEQFAYVASHDLQEPLRMVVSYTELLSRRYDGHLDADADEYIRYAVEGARRMRALIDDLLALGRVGTRPASFVPTDMAKVVGDAIEAVRAAIDESGATVEVAPDLPTITGDPQQLVQLLQNLLANAIKFRGIAPPHVCIGARPIGDDWQFDVADNGIGIEPSGRDRIFRVFQRLHGRGEYPGSGIGLSIVKKIVERHHGRVWVDSTPGRGSTFHFTLPMHAVPEGAARGGLRLVRPAAG